MFAVPAAFSKSWSMPRIRIMNVAFGVNPALKASARLGSSTSLCSVNVFVILCDMCCAIALGFVGSLLLGA